MFFLRTVLRAIPVLLAGTQLLPAETAPPARLTPSQENRLEKLLPKTLAKLKKRELIRVVSVGDSISTFYQPPGNPRYDSTMAWQGRMLTRLGAWYYYHSIVDVDPHREILAGQKEAVAAWERFKAESENWARTKKGPAPMAPDTLRFRADLESPVAMSVPQLIRRGPPSKNPDSDGTAIQILNLSRDGSQAAQILEALGPEAFPPAPLPGPDLVTICYGVNDAASSLPLAGYRTYLTQGIALCLKRGAEVIVAAPPVSYDPKDPRGSLGRARPYAQLAREVATAAGVAFVDLGEAAVDAPSDLYSLTVPDAFTAASGLIARWFDYGSAVVDTLHPNSRATVHLGEHAAVQLLGDSPASPVQISGGVEVRSAGEATAIIRLFNSGDKPLTVVASPLTFTGWQVKAGTADGLFNLPPGKARRFNLPLEPAATGTFSDGGAVRGSLILTDDARQRMVDLTLTLRPLALIWPEGRFDQVEGEWKAEPVLFNQTNLPVQGTARIAWMNRTWEVPVKIPAGKSMALPIRLPLPAPAQNLRLLETVAIDIDTGEQSMRFTRRIEGMRHLGLEQRIPLVLSREYPGKETSATSAAGVTPYADDRGLYFIFDAPGSGGSAPATGTIPWGSIELQLDGRKAGENGTAGFVDRLSAVIPYSDGPVTPKKVRPSVFGHTYHYNYHPDGFRVSASTRPNGSRRLEFNVARVNLAQHAWSLDGSGQSSLGVNVRITRMDPITGEPDPQQTWILNLNGFGATDARALTTLELSRTPSPKWSLRVF